NIKTSFYKSFGKNFLYLLQTGDSIDMGDDTYRQIYKRRNIAEVEISGFEIDLNYTFSKALNFQANYTFSQPIISAYKDDEQQTNSSLVGKYLAETPFQQVFSSICWNNKIVNTSVSYNLIGKQFADDLNEFELQRYYLIDLRFSRNFGNHISTNLDIQNILNQKYLDRKGNQSIGRFVLLSIQYKI
ncbi:MAG: TonB-dependent receptor, partial [Bacteroidetes bacterium]|nr:TonB-dependent receptor [Bacteroidota bacterium]